MWFVSSWPKEKAKIFLDMRRKTFQKQITLRTSIVQPFRKVRDNMLPNLTCCRFSVFPVPYLVGLQVALQDQFLGKFMAGKSAAANFPTFLLRARKVLFNLFAFSGVSKSNGWIPTTSCFSLRKPSTNSWSTDNLQKRKCDWQQLNSCETLNHHYII